MLKVKDGQYLHIFLVKSGRRRIRIKTTYKTETSSNDAAQGHNAKQCSGSMTFWCGSGSCYFRHWPSRHQLKNYLKKKFFWLLLFEGTFTVHNYSKKKSPKEVTNSRNQGFSYYYCLMTEESDPDPYLWLVDPDPGSPSKMWIRWIRIWIRIRNTDAKALLACGLPGEVARVGEDRVGEDGVGAAADLGTRLLGDVASAPAKPSLLPAVERQFFGNRLRWIRIRSGVWYTPRFFFKCHILNFRSKNAISFFLNPPKRRKGSRRSLQLCRELSQH